MVQSLALTLSSNNNAVVPTGAQQTAAAPATPFRIDMDDRVVVDNSVEYKRNFRTDDGYGMRRVDDVNIVEEFTHEMLYQLHKEGRLVIRRGYDTPGGARARLLDRATFVVDLGEKEQKRVDAKVDAITVFKKQEAAGLVTRSDDSLRTFISEFQIRRMNEQSIRANATVEIVLLGSPTTFRRNLRAFEACNGDPMCLVPGYGKSGNRTPRLPSHVLAFMNKYARMYLSSNKPSMAQLHFEMRHAFKLEFPGETPPSRGAFERRIRAFDQYKVMEARLGKDAAKRHFYAITQHQVATRPLEIVQIDENKLGLMTFLTENDLWAKCSPALKKGLTHDRFWLSKAFDVHSRVVLAIVISRNPSTESALATLRQVMEDKTDIARSVGCETAWSMFGVPETIVTDSGAPYRTTAFRSAALDLGITALIAPAGLPQMRGHLESSFLNDNKRFLSNFPGQTFADVIAKGDYVPEDHMSAVVDELAALYVRWVVDVHHNTPHAGLGGDTPLNVYRKGVAKFGVIQPPSEDVLRHVFAVQTRCRIRSAGVRVCGLDYQSKPLQDLLRTFGAHDVDVRFDNRNLGAVSVRFPDGFRTVPCMTPGFEGVDIASWMHLQADLRRASAKVENLASEVIGRALEAIRGAADAMNERQVTVRNRVVNPLMSDEDFKKVNHDLSQSFSIRYDKGTDLIGDAPVTAAGTALGRDAASAQDADDQPVQLHSSRNNAYFTE